MTEKIKNDGGAAFPTTEGNYGGASVHGQNGGMRLRDYFAAKATQGVIANGIIHYALSKKMVPEFCYAMADAMLAERNKS